MRNRHAAAAAALVVLVAGCTTDPDIDDDPVEDIDSDQAATPSSSDSDEDDIERTGNRLCDAVAELDAILAAGVETEQALADAYMTLGELYAIISSAIPDDDARRAVNTLSENSEEAGLLIPEAENLTAIEAVEFFSQSDAMNQLTDAMANSPEAHGMPAEAAAHINDECGTSLVSDTGLPDDLLAEGPTEATPEQAAAASALRLAVAELEASYVTEGTYTADAVARVSDDFPEGVQVRAARADDIGYCIEATHTAVDGPVASWNSAGAGIVYDSGC